MDAPVTRRELHEALDTWTGALTYRLESKLASKEELAAVERRLLDGVKMLIEESQLRLLGELRASLKATEAELATRLVVVDEQYKDLPARVSNLEAKVFAPPKRRRRAPRSR